MSYAKNFQTVEEAQPVETVFPERNQEHIIGKVALHAWIECARFLGALEER